MSYQVKQGNIFGRVGQNFAEGLGATVPKEVERARLSNALQDVKSLQNATPFDQFSYLAPYMKDNPQLLQNTTELLKHTAQANALKQQQQDIQGQPRVNPFQQYIDQQKQPSPSVTTPEGIEATKRPYIPMSFQQKQAEAGKLLNENPQLYGNDPNKALAAVESMDAANKARSEAFQNQRANEKGLLSDIKGALQNEAQRRNVTIPANEYSELENEAKRMFLPISEGGEGKTEEEIKDIIGKKADDISRDYQNLKNLGPGLILGRETKETKRAMESLRQKFAERNQLENFADTLVSDLKLSPQVAAYYAYPVKENQKIAGLIDNLPSLSNNTIMKENPDATFDEIERIKSQKTSNISSEIASKMGKNDSPMAIALYLRSKNYDPYEFLTYLKDNRKKLGLTEAQGRELDKPRNFGPNLNDNWMLFSSGLDQLVEK